MILLDTNVVVAFLSPQEKWMPLLLQLPGPTRLSLLHPIKDISKILRG